MKGWKKGLAALAVVCLLAAAFFMGGPAPNRQGVSVQETKQEAVQAEEETSQETKEAAKEAESLAQAAKEETTPDPVTPENTSNLGEETAPAEQEPAKPQTASAPEPGPTAEESSETEEKPLPVNAGEVTVTDEAHTCTLSVRCDSILDHWDWLDAQKTDLVPEDGVLFAATEVTFYEGETVFHVLQREMKRAGIHMEYEDTPLYQSAYIEGIGNLYEFDCGELSGWMYRVNGWYPNYGCSRYLLQEGDVVEWIYTCELGEDIGGSNRLEE